MASRTAWPLRRVAYATRASRAVLGQPYEGIERTLERLAGWRDSRRAGWPYPITDGFERRVHELIGARWPCEHDGFEDVWGAAIQELRAEGMQIGRGTFGGWDDADIRLGRVAWCLARQLRPERVVETGVARGLVTHTLLAALAHNGAGHLWSIDLPPLIETSLAEETAAAVPEPLRDRWTLLRGSSRRHLPTLIDALGDIDLFVHDSMHTTRNLSFELAHAWPALSSIGTVLIDDVEKNTATGTFLQARPDTPAVISPSADGTALIGVLSKQAGGGRY